MSALWVLALGASMGYLVFKRQVLEGRLQMAVKEWDGAGATSSVPMPPDGANVREIKQAWKYTADTRNLDFNERLPDAERAPLLAAEDARAREVHAFDRAGPAQDIEGVYLE
mgnify:CR=1 FL=1